MSKYREMQEKIRQEAIECQLDFEKQDYCWGDLLIYHQYFEDKARKYGLIKEFRENGII
jgi:hypothetical protein